MKHITPYQYAKLCGLTRQAIYKRIKSGTLSTTSHISPDGSVKQYIDINLFPPGKKEWAGGRPKRVK